MDLDGALISGMVGIGVFRMYEQLNTVYYNIDMSNLFIPMGVIAGLMGMLYQFRNNLKFFAVYSGIALVLETFLLIKMLRREKDRKQSKQLFL